MSIYLPIVTSFNDKGIKSAKREFQSLQSRSQKAGFILKKAFLPAVGVLGALGGFLAGAARGAEQARIASAGLQSVLKTMGFETATKRVEDYAESLELLLGVDADVIKRTQTKLATFRGLTKSVDKAGGAFDRATVAALDMAAAGFGEAEGNAVQLGKALEDPIKGLTALAKSGVTFTDKEKEKIKQLVKSNKLLEAQDIILSAIEGQVGGTAEASVSSFDKIKLAVERVKDVFGEALIPVIERLMPYVERFSAWATENKGLVLGVATAIGVLAAAIVAANIAITLSNPFGAIAAGITVLVTGLVIAYNKFEWFRKGVDTIIGWIRRYFEIVANSWIEVINVIIRGYNALPFLDNIELLQRVDFTPDTRAGASGANFRRAEMGSGSRSSAFSATQGLGPYAPSDPRSRQMVVNVNVQGGDPAAVVDALRRYSRQNGGITGVRLS